MKNKDVAEAIDVALDINRLIQYKRAYIMKGDQSPQWLINGALYTEYEEIEDVEMSYVVISQLAKFMLTLHVLYPDLVQMKPIVGSLRLYNKIDGWLNLDDEDIPDFIYYADKTQNSVIKFMVKGIPLVSVFCGTATMGGDVSAIDVLVFPTNVKKYKKQILDFLTKIIQLWHDRVCKLEKRRITLSKGILDKLILRTGVKEKLFNYINNFILSEDLYKKELKLPWKLGILFEGPSGNGKTMTIRTIIKYFGLAYDDMCDRLDNRSNILLPKTFADSVTMKCYKTSIYSLYDFIYGNSSNKPVLIYAEDLDLLLDDDYGFSSVSKSAINNTLEGVNTIDDLLFIATTSNADRIPDFIIQKSGRIDETYFFDNPDADQISRFMDVHNISLKRGTQEKVIDILLKGRMSMAMVEKFIIMLKNPIINVRDPIKLAETIVHKIKQNELIGFDKSEYNTTSSV